MKADAISYVTGPGLKLIDEDVRAEVYSPHDKLEWVKANGKIVDQHEAEWRSVLTSGLYWSGRPKGFF